MLRPLLRLLDVHNNPADLPPAREEPEGTVRMRERLHDIDWRALQPRRLVALEPRRDERRRMPPHGRDLDRVFVGGENKRACRVGWRTRQLTCVEPRRDNMPAQPPPAVRGRRAGRSLIR